MSGPQDSQTTLSARRQRLRALFPVSDNPALRLSRLEATVVVAALLALAVILALLRLGWSSSLNVVWAEDGPIYLQGALTGDFWSTIVEPYAGYLVLGPRLIAAPAALVPLEHAPAAVAILSALVAALSALAVWFASGGLIRNPYLRGALALTVVLAPTAGSETLNSAAYAPWYMLVAAFWLLFWRPATMRAAVLGGVFVLLTGLSTPGVWFFLPVALLRALTVDNRRDATLLGGFFVGAAVQVPVVLGQEQGEPFWTNDIWTAYLQRAVDGGIFGQDLGGRLWVELGWPFLVLLTAALVVALIAGAWRARPPARWFIAFASVTSFVMFVISAYQRTVGENLIWEAGSWAGTASRYVMVPALLLLSAAVVAVDASLRERQRTGLAWPVAATLAVLLAAIVTSFDMRDPVRESPIWDNSLRQAATICVRDREGIAGIATAPEPFGVQLPCEEIESFAR